MTIPKVVAAVAVLPVHTETVRMVDLVALTPETEAAAVPMVDHPVWEEIPA